jgi:hypothetical protein
MPSLGDIIGAATASVILIFLYITIVNICRLATDADNEDSYKGM